MLVCKARRRRRRHADPVPSHDPLPDGAFADSGSSGAAQGELLPNDPAPSYFSAAHHPESAAQELEPARRLWEKARYVPAQGPSAPSAWRGWSGPEDGGGSVVDGGAGRVAPDRAESVYPGSSLAAETSPPSYQSESRVTL